MMKSVATWTAAALVLGASTAAHAADLDGPRRYDSGPSYRPFSWTGLYVGVHGGLGWSDADWNFANASLSHSGYGGLLGAQVGYNFQIGRAVLGLEGDYSGSWLGGSDACPNPAFNCSHDINWLGSMRGRFGYTFNDNRTLVYGTAGLAWVDGTANTRTAGGVNFGSGLDFSQRGWVAGAGFEHMLTQNLSARFEYLYYGFDGINAGAGVLDTTPTKIDLSSQVVRFGLNYKF
jgi:outer membrane immunogenic protein